MSKVIVLAAVQERFDALQLLLEGIEGISVFRISSKEDLTYDSLSSLKPAYVFFPQWNWILPAEVVNAFECVMFHMTDLPYGRGGSPLQNLIVRGKKETMLSAFQCDQGVDTGPVYLKQSLSLDGTAEEIFERAIPVIATMAREIIKNNPVPKPQNGEPTFFKRRKPEDGDISSLSSLDAIYDYIRMLDGAGYPNAFLESGGFKYEFKNAKLLDNELIADVRIKPK